MKPRLSIVVLAAFSVAGCQGPFDSSRGTVDVEFGEGPVSVPYQLVGDDIVIEGDMIIGSLEDLAGGALTIPPLVAPGSLGSPDPLADNVVFAAIATRAWPSGRIPYKVRSELDWGLRNNVASAIAKWNDTGTVRFVPASSADSHVVDIRAGDTPSVGHAEVGFDSDDTTRTVRLGFGASERLVLHELGHIIGLIHEHTRTDRDDHVAINWGNIDPDYEDNFEMLSGSTRRDYRAYDIHSLMHYSSTSFALNKAVLTMAKAGCGFSPNVPACRVGPSNEPTKGDIRGVFRVHAGISTRLRNDLNERCMRPSGGSTAIGAKIITSSCNNSSSRRWYLYDRTEDGYLVVNEHSLRCLTTAGSSGGLVQATCGNGQDQRFDMVSTSGGHQLRSRQHNRCVRRISSQSQLVLASCRNTSSRRWFLQSSSDW